MMDFQVLRMNRSPFHKDKHHSKYEHGEQMEKVDFRISKSAYNDLMRFFKGNGLTKTEGFRGMVSDKLAMINNSRRTVFKNIEFIMLIPKSASVVEMSEKARVIALYNTDCDFTDDFNYQYGFDSKFNYQYDLRTFGEGFFREEMRIINSTKESPVMKVNKGDLENWNSFYSRLNELNRIEKWDLNLDDCYYVRCPLNNYLDINRDGQFQSPTYDGKHEGIYIFNDLQRRLFCLVNWSYSHENQSISFEIFFIIILEFMKILEEADFKPLRDSYSNLENSAFDKERMDNLIKSQERFLEFLKNERDNM